jgi:hypothetical protein
MLESVLIGQFQNDDGFSTFFSETGSGKHVYVEQSTQNLGCQLMNG